MEYNIFTSEPTASQIYDFNKYISSLPTSKEVDGETIVIDNTNYIASTTCWAAAYQRATDDKWVYAVCPDSDASYTTETYNENWRTE